MLILSYPGLPMRAAEIHVSPGGDEGGAGAAQAPAMTLAAAQIAARKLAGKEPVTILLADGVYYLDKPLTFGPEDSGNATNPVQYKAEHEGGAVISGGEKLSLVWEPYKGGIYKASTPPGVKMDQLFINGKRQILARYPNYDPEKVHEAYRGSSADAISPARVARWADPEGGYIHAMHPAMWGGFEYLITGKDGKGNLTYTGGWQNNRPAPMNKRAIMVENIFEELDAPGEWFHDAKHDLLYYYPAQGVDLPKATVEIVRLASLLEFRGTQAQPVHHISVDGVTFRHTARTFMETREPLLRSDWAIYRGGAIYFEGAEDCAVSNGFIDQPGGNGVFVSGYDRRLRFSGMHAFDVGASAFAFVGRPDAVRSPLFGYGAKRAEPIDTAAGPRSDDYPMDCAVEDSLIHEVGTVEKQGAGVEISMSRRITVRHCSIYNTSRSGINIGDGCWGGHVIEYCDIFDTVQETGDHGSFNSWGRDRYWGSNGHEKEYAYLDAMEPTYLRNSRWRCDHGWDIDLDDGSTNYRIIGNLCLNGGIKLREGFGRQASNNITVNNTMHLHVWYKDSGDVITHNILMGPYRLAMAPAFKWGKELDYNLFTTSDADRLRYAAGEPAADEHSIAGAPRFIDPATGDFRVAPDSPALKVGFENFPMDQFGVLKPSLRAIAKTPVIPGIKAAAMALAKEQAVHWMGAQLGEPRGGTLSAYGVPFDSGGVSIDSMAAGSPLAGLASRDLIRAFNGAPITGIAGLRKAVAAVKPGAPVTLGIVRGQAETKVSLPASLELQPVP